MKKLVITSLVFCMIFSLFAISASASTSPVEIDGVGYDTLQNAVKELPTDGTQKTITLNDDITINSALSFPVDTNVVLDLNNHTLNVGSVSDIAIFFKGDMTVKNGTISDQRGLKGGSYTIRVSSGTTNILAGTTIDSTTGSGALQVGATTSSVATLNVYDGVKVNTAYNAFYAYNVTNFNIYGGEFTSTASDGRVAKILDGTSVKAVYGGTFKNTNATSSTALNNFVNGYSNAKFYGGTFTTTAAKLSPASTDLETKDNGDGTYSIVPKSSVTVYKNDNLNVTSTWDIISSITNEGDVISLVGNTTITSKLNIDKSITFDLKGFTLTSTYAPSQANVASILSVSGNSNVTIKNGRIINTSDNTKNASFAVQVGTSKTDSSSLTLGDEKTTLYIESASPTNVISLPFGNKASLTVNEGVTVYCSNSSAANCIFSYGKLVINGGTFTNANSAMKSVKSTGEGSTAVINGGTFNNKIENETYANFKIYGGTFEREIIDNAALVYGGNFAIKPAGVQSGYYANKTAQSRYNVSNTTAAKLGDEYYETLSVAVSDAADEDSVTLYANDDTAIVVDKVLTVVKNGYTANLAAAEGYELTDGADSYVIAAVVAKPTVEDILSEVQSYVFSTETTKTVRFVAPIDTLEYKAIGFIINNPYSEGLSLELCSWKNEGKDVYSQIVIDNGGSTVTLAPTDLHSNAAYLFTTAIGEIPSESPVGFGVKAFAIKADGTVVFGRLVNIAH